MTRLRVWLHCRKAGHQSTFTDGALGFRNYYCATCGYPQYQFDRTNQGNGAPQAPEEK